MSEKGQLYFNGEIYTVDDADRAALAYPDIFVNTAGDLALLEPMIAAAERWLRAGSPEAPEQAPMRAAADALGMEPLFVRGMRTAR